MQFDGNYGKIPRIIFKTTKPYAHPRDMKKKFDYDSDDEKKLIDGVDSLSIHSTERSELHSQANVDICQGQESAKPSGASERTPNVDSSSMEVKQTSSSNQLKQDRRIIPLRAEDALNSSRGRCFIDDIRTHIDRNKTLINAIKSYNKKSEQDYQAMLKLINECSSSAFSEIDSYGCPLLHLAIRCNLHLNLIFKIINNTSRKDLERTFEGSNAIQVAIENKKHALLILKILEKMSPNSLLSKNRLGETALTLAIKNQLAENVVEKIRAKSELAQIS